MKEASKNHEIREVSRGANQYSEVSEKHENREVNEEASQYAEASFSKEDQISQQLPSVPKGSNVFYIKTTDNQNGFGEEGKEAKQSEIAFCVANKSSC